LITTNSYQNDDQLDNSFNRISIGIPSRRQIKIQRENAIKLPV